MPIQATIHSATRQRTRLDLAARGAVEDCKEATRLYGREIALKMSGACGGDLGGFAYPAVTSKYRRTFTLQNAWLAQAERTDVKETSKGFEYEFYIDVVDTNARTPKQGYGEHYAVKVQGNEHGDDQKAIHAENGWHLFINVLDRPRWHREISQVIRFLKRKPIR